VFIWIAPRYAPAQAMQIIKSITTGDMFEAFPHLRKRLWAGKFCGVGISFTA